MRSILTLAGALLLGSLNAQAADCLPPGATDALLKSEYHYLAGRKVPAMQHAIEDGRLKLAIAPATIPGKPGCAAALEMSIAQSDIDEVARSFEQNPAKRIMLMSQGYALPESTRINTVFSFDPATLAVAHADTLHSGELGKSRATIELLYATQSQLRAVIPDNASNAVPWSDALKTRQTAACTKKMSARDTAAACACRNDALAKTVGERQMEYVEYLFSDPYSYATGALATFNALAEQVNSRCGLKPAR
ncbi:MAG: hypothetical protein FGM62_02745 [Methylobacterium sp.]|nr:hypothetical protein [Methylobacterium sp.]